MKKILFLALFLSAFIANGQHTISGTFSPAADYTWLIAYKLKQGTQVYTADTAIKNGAFSMTLPASADPGMYRMVYAIPQEEFYFDIIYTSDEDIVLSFDANEGVTFESSKENQIFASYFREIEQLQQELVDYYTSGAQNDAQYNDIVQSLQKTQETFEKDSKGMIAYDFITANAPYIPKGHEDVETYVTNKKAHYFDHLPLDSPKLQASGFLTDKLANFVFTALPIHEMDQATTEKAMNNNVDAIAQKTTNLDPKYKVHLLYTLWSQAVASNLNDTADHIYHSYLKKWAQEANDPQLIAKIEEYNRLRIGVVAPKIQAEGSSLSDLEDADCYLLVFWSSTCPHCLNELPKLQKALEKNSNIKVLAIGIEDDKNSWERQKAKLPMFKHAISMGKWESEAAQTYMIQRTPTYFVLDSEKKIKFKPENYEALMEYLKEDL